MSRTQIEISLGVFLILATSLVMLVYGVNENTRMERFVEGQHAQSVEVGATLFETYCSRCHGSQGLGTPGLCPPLNDRNFFDNRLKEVGWSGTQEDYIVATASGGRLASTRPTLYAGAGTPAMPAFGDAYGGPLRADQIRDIATFIMNWSSTAQVVQPPPTPSGPLVGTDITKQLPAGDAQAGQQAATLQGCVVCHVTGNVGPAWMATADQPGIGTRAAQRITQPDYTGQAKTPEQYLFESIVHPEAYLVPGFQDLMPKTFGQTLTEQTTADLIAYLMTLK